MTVTAPRRGLRALFEEARRRARRRHAVYVAAGVAVVVSAGYLALDRPFSGDGAERVAPRPEVPAPPGELLKRRPYLGVTCDGRPNWIGCDRVGLAVWLREPAQSLSARINGREVAMVIPCGNREFPGPCAPYCRAVRKSNPCWTAFQGFLRPAGLLDGPLKVRPDRGRYHWIGRSESPVAVIELTARYRGGKVARTRTRVPLAAGYG